MVPISVPGYSWPIDSRILAATNEPAFMSEFPFQRDMNIGNPVRFILAIAILFFFFDRLPFCGVDWLWLGTRHHWSRST